ncbi:MAG TPA: peptidylprolyl isomerase [Chitinophagaceae bacterium]|jgi:peptidyl-prolyl cis-trans isomerase SurA|nr:peptidylprolyl isomerase [Chitinophagaceae bacterium]
MKKYFLLSAGIFLVAILSAQPGTQAKKIVADKITAVVGDRIIMYSDIKNTIADYVRQGAEIPNNAECLILDQAILSKVLMQQAEKDSLPITDEEVDADLDLRVREFIRVYGSEQAVVELAGKSIYQIKEDAKESVREKKLAEAMQRKIVENVKITPAEVKAFFERIPKDSLPFYESELEVGQIVIYPQASRDLEKYIIDELNHYKQRVESKSAKFEDLAKLNSEDPGSKERGGQYQINRKDKSWDPSFIAAAFRLKEGEISQVVKTKFGYHIIQMVQRNGDEAIIRHILRTPPITEEETNASISKLDSVRAKIIAGTLNFNQAALKYSEDEQQKFAGPFFTGRDGSTYVTIDELDKDVVAMLGKLKVGDISQPTPFTDQQRGKKGVRIVYLKSRSQPHRMNLKDDYNKIAQFALEEKKAKAMDKWLASKLPTYYIMVADDFNADCPNVQKYASKKAF